VALEAGDVLGYFCLPAQNCPVSLWWPVPSPHLLLFRMELVSRKLSSRFRMTLLVAAVPLCIRIVNAAVSWRLPTSVIKQGRGKLLRGLGVYHNDPM